MSFVCLWHPAWPTVAASGAESDAASAAHAITAAILAHAPRVHAAANGRVWVDARGLDASALANTLLDVVTHLGYADAHASAALTMIGAELAATACDAPLLVVRPGTDRDFLARFPVAVLEPSTLAASILDGFGVDTCGQLAALDAESVEVRLGAEGVKLWKLARAEDARTVFTRPVRPLPSAAYEWTEYALKHPERLLFVINALVNSVCDAMTSRGDRARELVLDFALVDRSHYVHTLRASRPTAVASAWMRVARVALDRVTLPDAVTGVEVRVERITGNDAAQGDLFDRGFASAPAVERAIAQLADDQGDVVLVPKNSAHPLIDKRTEWVAQSPSSAVDESEATRLKQLGKIPDPQLTLQLFDPPRPVRVDVKRRRDHQMPVRYRESLKTRGAKSGWWQLVDVAGPDRVSGGQWETPYAREYFRCVREDGVLVWLYRDVEEWFLQGVWD